MVKIYVPEQGDIIWFSFDLQTGHEQKGRRPALVLSCYLFNKKTGLAFVAPITNTNRNYPLHIPLTDNNKTQGFVMSEQVKSLDLTQRKPELIEKICKNTLSEVLLYFKAFFAENT